MALREAPVPLSDERRRSLVQFLADLGLSGPGLTDPLNPDLDLDPIEEALTHSSAGLPINHERLEFLGDAVLRLAAAEFLERHHKSMDVGQRSALRAQLVSDRWLAELAERCGIEAVVHLGPVAAGDSAARQTIRAEICEALIGGLYEATGSLAPVHSWLTPHWQRSTSELLADPYRHNWKTGLQEWSQARGLGLPRYLCEERSRLHGDPRRFHCSVNLNGQPLGEGWGGSRRDAEQQAARMALAQRQGFSSLPASSEAS
jgi:ribonuclease-3